MNALVRTLKGVARFLYGFVVGDDWVVAAIMLLALIATGRIVAAGVNAWWLVPALAIGMTGFSLRRRRPARNPDRVAAEAQGLG